jgi:hypothetical protein
VGPECISRAIERAATDRRPRARYLAPFRAVVMMWFVKRMPTSWADAVMRAAVGLTKRRFAKALPSPVNALPAETR